MTALLIALAVICTWFCGTCTAMYAYGHRPKSGKSALPAAFIWAGLGASFLLVAALRSWG